VFVTLLTLAMVHRFHSRSRSSFKLLKHTLQLAGIPPLLVPEPEPRQDPNAVPCQPWILNCDPQTPRFANVCCYEYALGLEHCEIVIGPTCAAAHPTQIVTPRSAPLSIRREPWTNLSWGPGSGKSCLSVTWNEIRSCVNACERAFPANFPTGPSWNCQLQARKCSSGCCLTSTFDVQFVADDPFGCLPPLVQPPLLYPGWPGSPFSH
jgi:hypothetical protein